VLLSDAKFFGAIPKRGTQDFRGKFSKEVFFLPFTGHPKGFRHLPLRAHATISAHHDEKIGEHANRHMWQEFPLLPLKVCMVLNRHSFSVTCINCLLPKLPKMYFRELGTARALISVGTPRVNNCDNLLHYIYFCRKKPNTVNYIYLYFTTHC